MVALLRLCNVLEVVRHAICSSLTLARIQDGTEALEVPLRTRTRFPPRLTET